MGQRGQNFLCRRDFLHRIRSKRNTHRIADTFGKAVTWGFGTVDEITAMALSLPEHTVVPYANVPKKQYPKNIPLEVYSHEETTV